ncbi:MAG: PAS domain S-box protein [Clostridia bacterium]|nr:PAS domain S-box protein [Clostridia bacterium]
MLDKTKEEILIELRKKEEQIKALEDKVLRLNTKIFTHETDSIYKLFFENSQDGYIVMEKNKIVECNNSAVKMFGYKSKKDLIGLIPFEIAFQKKFKDKLYSKKKGEGLRSSSFNKKVTFDWIIQRKDDKDLPIEVSITELLIDGNIISFASLRSISERIKAQRIFKENEKLYRDIFETNRSVVLLIDPKYGKIIDANLAACLFYGYDKEKLINMNISKINILNNDEKIVESIEGAVKGENKHFYINQRLANDEIRFVEVYCNKVAFGDEDLVYFIVNDLTNMKRILSALEESEKKFKALFNKAKDAIYLYKLDKYGKPNTFMEVNDSACKRYGYKREELLNMTIKDIEFIEDNIETFDKTQNITKDEHATFESIHASKHGDKIPVEVNFHKFKLFGDEVILSIARDITQRKWIEKFLRESEERNRRLVELLPDPIILQKDGRILYINQVAIKFLGGENRHSFIGRNIFDFIDIHPCGNKTLLMKELGNEMNDLSSFNELKIIRKVDNAILEVETTSTIFNYCNKKATLIMFRDLSDRKKAEKYVKLFNEAIEYDKLKTKFFANLSHELRTPLNVILGTIQILTLYLKESSLQSKEQLINNKVKVLKQNCYRLLRLVNNLIDITKIDAGFYELELQNHNIVHVVEEITLSVTEYAQQKKIRITFDTDIEEKLIACDPDKIERIMLNLLSNAIKFTHENGDILVDIFDKGKSIMISVKDTGIGIPKDEIKYIFEHFRQVDKSFTRNHEGSGIGLSLVKSLVEMHDGTITVKSEYGRGSEFIIELPARTLEDKESMIRENNGNELSDNLIEIINIEFSDIYS